MRRPFTRLLWLSQREAHGTGTDGDGEKEQAPEIFTEVDTTGFEGQNKHEGWLQSLLTALLATYH